MLKQVVSKTLTRPDPSISAAQLRTLKAAGGPIASGMRTLLQVIDTYTETVSNFPDFGSLTYVTYYNSYPQFTDTNNLSLVLFLHYPGVSFVFPGDLERAGWLQLLQSAAFRQDLARVRIFVASHHGRESGYCKEVFRYCQPDIVVITDEAIKYQTQERSYATHASGITWNSTDTRRVLTTRRDGMLTITSSGNGYYIQAGHR